MTLKEMKEKNDFEIELERHLTKDVLSEKPNGELTVIWRDWDGIVKNFPKMVYVSSVNSGQIKGPHLHTKRNSYFCCIHGKVVFIIKTDNGEYREIISSTDEPNMVFVPKGIGSAHVNLSNQTSRVLALADISWRPNDNEMINVSFDDYDFKKWFKPI